MESGAHIEIIYMEEGVVSTPDCIAIVNNAPHMEYARLFIDFATGYEVQTMLTTKLNRRSVRKDVADLKNLKSKEEFKIISVDDEKVYSMKKDWIHQFRELFLNVSND